MFGFLFLKLLINVIVQLLLNFAFAADHLNCILHATLELL